MTTKVITNNRPILLGKSGENEATLIKFPINVFFPFVNATSFSLVHQRHGDVAPYPCVISQGEGFINWSINSADVANQGNGVAQLTAYNEEGLVAKTVVFTTVVTDSLGYVTPPAPQTAWVDQVAGYAYQAEQAAMQASEAAATAQSVFAPGSGRDSIVSVNAVYPNVASEHDSVAIGGSNQSTASGAVTIGTLNVASAQNAVAIGSKLAGANPNTASAPAATALGLSCTASGYGSVAMGYNTTASNTGAFSAGYTSVASGQAAASIGFQTTASGTAAAAIGYGTTASGTGAAAVGRDATASGAASTALGRGTTASASQALAAGRDSKAEAVAATALGYGTDATGARSFVAGAYNQPDENDVDSTHGSGARKYLMIVGNGTADNARSNAMTLDWDGNMELAGSIRLGNTVLTEAQLRALLALLN